MIISSCLRPSPPPCHVFPLEVRPPKSTSEAWVPGGLPEARRRPRRRGCLEACRRHDDGDDDDDDNVARWRGWPKATGLIRRPTWRRACGTILSFVGFTPLPPWADPEPRHPPSPIFNYTVIGFKGFFASKPAHMAPPKTMTR